MRWKRFFTRKRSDQELARELEEYLAIGVEENIARGLPLDRARCAARRKLGNQTLVREEVYLMNSLGFLDSLWQDIRYSLRALAKTPAFTLVVVASLALGIGANTAIFSLIDAALLKMLPVSHPERLVTFTTAGPLGPDDGFSWLEYQAFLARTRVFSGVLAFRTLGPRLNVEVNGQGGLATGQVVSGNYFQVLGVNAIAGRTILPEDDKPGAANPVAVLSFDYWQTRFASDPGIAGKTVVLNNSIFTVAGVTPPEFFGLQPGRRFDVSIPLSTFGLISDFAATGTRYDIFRSPVRNWLTIIGRLQPGIALESALADLAPPMKEAMRNKSEALAGLPFDSPAARRAYLGTTVRLEPGGQGLAALRRRFSRPLYIIMAVVALLLLVTCANVANLLLARANAREKELAVRLTVGARRHRLIRQFITESVLLAFAGGVSGLALAFLATRAILALMQGATNSPASLSVHPSGTVLAFTMLVSLLTALLFGLVPAWRAARLDLTPTLLQTTRSSGRSGRRSGLGNALVVLQVAVSLVLMVGAGLLTRSLGNLTAFNPGFNKNNVLLLSLNPALVGYKDPQMAALFERLVDRVQSIPEVQSASLTVHSVLSGGFATTEPSVQGYTPRAGQEMAAVGIDVIGPDHFRTLQTAILAGREFTRADRIGAPKVAIVNETMARGYFGNLNPIGQRFSIPAYRGDASPIEIVGLVTDVKSRDLREVSRPMAYIPLLQAPEALVTMEVRTATDPRRVVTAVRQQIQAINPRLPVYDVKTLSSQFDDSLVQERMVTLLSSLFGGLAVLLACIGLYGLMSYAVNRRTNEIGIRMALGARRVQIGRMVLRETLTLVAAGLAIGIPAAIAASRLLASELFGLKAGDPSTTLLASVAMAAIAALAGSLPSRRASRVDPMTALRYE